MGLDRLADTSGQFLTPEDIGFVRDLVRGAGRKALEMRQGVKIKEKAGPHDPVTDADLALSKMLTAALQARFPEDVVISEEDNFAAQPAPRWSPEERTWFVDPIDGTRNYIDNDGQYSVMVGVALNLQAVFGWIHAPALSISIYGGPGYGTFRQRGNDNPERCPAVPELQASGPRRLMMGLRDRKNHSWLDEISAVEFIKSGSVGLKVGMIFNDEADAFIHLSGKLKLWDTAAPAAIATGAGLDVGTLGSDTLQFAPPCLEHPGAVIIGRAGSLDWIRVNMERAA